MIVSDPDERGRFLRFAMVGAIGAAVDFSVFNLLVNVGRTPTIWASVLSFLAAVLSNFVWNRFWTYPDSRSKKISNQVVQFSAVSLIGLGIRTPLFVWLERVLIRNLVSVVPRNFLVSGTFIGHNAALAIAILVVMLWNFYANRLWTYNDVT
jgi:putative flippase GtrA